MGTSYPGAPSNPSPLDVMNSAAFGPAVLRAIQTPSVRAYTVAHSYPWEAIDLPMVNDLPQSPIDRMEVNLLVGEGVTRMVYRAATNRWYQIGAAPQVTTLPTGVPEGTQVIYGAPGSAGPWHLFYDSSAGDPPWYFLGGIPLFAEITASEATSSTSYVALTTPGPSVALPLAGAYDVEIGSFIIPPASAGATAFMSYAIGGTGASDLDAVTARIDDAATPRNSASGIRPRRKTGLTAVTLTANYRVTASTSTFASRWMRVTPVAVGP